MKAMRIHQHGGPEVLKLEQIDEPRPGAGEVTVRVKACAMNRLDLWTRNGLPGVHIPMPHISHRRMERRELFGKIVLHL